MPDLSLLPPSAAIEGNDLRIGGCSLKEIAAEFGTPAFIFDEQALRARARAFADGLAQRHRRSRVCFATKSFPSSSMISILASEGLGFDVVGEGELRIALAGGADPAMIVMHGNAKSDEDIQAALDAGIGYIVVDGFDDIDRIARWQLDRRQSCCGSVLVSSRRLTWHSRPVASRPNSVCRSSRCRKPWTGCARRR